MGRPAGVKLHVQPEADPADLQTTAAEGRAAQTGACALWEERATLDQDRAEVRLEDGDPVDRVVGPHHERREGVHECGRFGVPNTGAAIGRGPSRSASDAPPRDRGERTTEVGQRAVLKTRRNAIH